MEQLQKNNLFKIKKYLEDKAEHGNLEYIILSNINFNFNTDTDLINIVTLWFSKDSKEPVYVTKIIRSARQEKTISDYIKFTASTNKSLHKKYFNQLSIERIDDVVFSLEKTCAGNTFETDLKNAILGPEKNIGQLNSVLKSQITQMQELFLAAEKIKFDKSKLNWSQEFCALVAYLDNFIKNEQIKLFNNEMANIIAKLELEQTLVVPDLVNPNIFHGPILIDNAHSKINQLQDIIPGKLNYFRYLLLTIISPPINYILHDQAAAITCLCKQINIPSKSITLNLLKNLIADEPFTDVEKLSLFIFSINYEFAERMEIFKNDQLKINEQINAYVALLNSIIYTVKNGSANIDEEAYQLEQQVDDQKITFPRLVKHVSSNVPAQSLSRSKSVIKNVRKLISRVKSI